MTSRKLLTTALGALLATTGLALVPSSAPAQASPAETATAYRADPIAWTTCSDKGLRKAKAQCGLLTVPLDHANPAGPTIQIAVSRVLHTKGPYRGAAFVNPGGPGASGIGLAPFMAQAVPDKVGRTYDWYGFDPRGAGDSVPALSCDPGFANTAHQPYQPKTPEVLNYWLTKTEAYAAACGASAAKALLPHLKTTDTVADLEVLRTAIGQAQVTYYGFSWGTYLGQVWATQHPTSLKAMVFDGVVDPSRVWYHSNLDQDYAFQKVYSKFFRWAGRYDRDLGLGRTGQQVDKTIAKLRTKLGKKPFHGVGAAEVDDLLTNAGYNNQTWPAVATALSRLVVDKDAKLIRKYTAPATGPGADNGYAMYLATTCTDAPWPKDWNQIAADNAIVDKDAPYIAWSNGWFNAPCRTWPAASNTAAPVVNGAGYTGPLLLISETYDPATPYSGAKAVKGLFPTSRLVVGKGGTTHSASLSGVSCVDDAVADLLATGKLPARKAGNVPDKTCPGLPAPKLSAERSAALRVGVR